MADLAVVENAAGDVFVGIEREGVFVSVASVSKARIDHLVERGRDLGKRLEDENDKAAQEAVDTLPIAVSKPAPEPEPAPQYEPEQEVS